MTRNKIKKEILEKIGKSEVRMRPGWWFWAKEGGIRSLWLMTVLLAASGIMGVIYFWQIYSLGELWEYGEVGQTILIEDFPHIKALFSIIGVALGTWWLIKIGSNYKRGAIVRLTINLLAVGLVASGWWLVVLFFGKRP